MFSATLNTMSTTILARLQSSWQKFASSYWEWHFTVDLFRFLSSHSILYVHFLQLVSLQHLTFELSQSLTLHQLQISAMFCSFSF